MLKRIRYLLLFTFISLAMNAYADTDTQLKEPELPTSGWQQLFNGKEVEDWSFVGLGNFAVDKGMLMSGGKTGILWYNREKFGNCVVRVVYKVSDKTTSSGVFVLIPKPPVDVWDAVNHAYQIKIQDYADEYHRTGSVYSLSAASIAPTKPPGEWNTLDIFLQGDHVKVYVNGELVSTYNPSQPLPPKQASSDSSRGPRPTTGYIGVLNHNDLINDKMGQIWFKEISVLPIMPAQE